MRDLTEAVAPICETVQSFAMFVVEGGVYHRVEFGPKRGGRYQHDWSCSCGKASCDHIRSAKTQRCGWNRELEPQRIPDGDVCPWCAGPLKFVRVGV